MLNLALIVGSTRPNRFSDFPANSVAAAAAACRDFQLDVLDLREQRLPLFDEPPAARYPKDRLSEPRAEAWWLKLVPISTECPPSPA